MKWFLILVLVVLLMVLTGCEEESRMDLFVDDNPCPKSNSTYCHLYSVDGGVVYINFSANGTFEYVVTV